MTRCTWTFSRIGSYIFWSSQSGQLPPTDAFHAAQITALECRAVKIRQLSALPNLILHRSFFFHRYVAVAVYTCFLPVLPGSLCSSWSFPCRLGTQHNPKCSFQALPTWNCHPKDCLHLPHHSGQQSYVKNTVGKPRNHSFFLLFVFTVLIFAKFWCWHFWIRHLWISQILENWYSLMKLTKTLHMTKPTTTAWPEGKLLGSERMRSREWRSIWHQWVCNSDPTEAAYVTMQAATSEALSKEV